MIFLSDAYGRLLNVTPLEEHYRQQTVKECIGDERLNCSLKSCVVRSLHASDVYICCQICLALLIKSCFWYIALLDFLTSLSIRLHWNRLKLCLYTLQCHKLFSHMLGFDVRGINCVYICNYICICIYIGTSLPCNRLNFV